MRRNDNEEVAETAAAEPVPAGHVFVGVRNVERKVVPPFLGIPCADTLIVCTLLGV